MIGTYWNFGPWVMVLSHWCTKTVTSCPWRISAPTRFTAYCSAPPLWGKKFFCMSAIFIINRYRAPFNSRRMFSKTSRYSGNVNSEASAGIIKPAFSNGNIWSIYRGDRFCLIMDNNWWSWYFFVRSWTWHHSLKSRPCSYTRLFYIYIFCTVGQEQAVAQTLLCFSGRGRGRTSFFEIPNILPFTSTMQFDLTQKKMSCLGHFDIRVKVFGQQPEKRRVFVLLTVE